MPDVDFFREVQNQERLLNILFIFCKLNTDVGYRQGMHEVLAPVLWVVSEDTLPLSPTDDGVTEASPNGSTEDLLKSLLDPQHVEHDAFTLFCIIMQTAKSFYETGDQSRSSLNPSSNAPIVERSRRIHEDLLRQADIGLANHLNSIDILPQIFVMYAALYPYPMANI